MKNKQNNNRTKMAFTSSITFDENFTIKKLNPKTWRSYQQKTVLLYIIRTADTETCPEKTSSFKVKLRKY